MLQSFPLILQLEVLVTFHINVFHLNEQSKREKFQKKRVSQTQVTVC